MNLLTNAIDEVAPDGNVNVTTGLAEWPHKSPAGRVLISDRALPGTFVFAQVIDSESGIPADALERIFDPYVSSRGHGRGLGLAAVAGIVRDHRGLALVNSVEGQGGEIRVLIALSNPAGAA